MMATFINWLQPSTYDADENKLVAVALNTILVVVIFGISLFMLFLFLSSNEHLEQYGILLLGLSSSFILKVMLNAGYFHLTSRLFIGLTWFVVSIAPISDIGVYSPSMMSFVLVILFSGIFGNRHAPIYATIACILSTIGIVWMMEMGWVVHDLENHSPILTTIMAYILNFVVVGAVTYATANLVSQSIKQLEQSKKQVEETSHHLKRAEEIARLGNFEYDVRTQELTWSDQMYRIFGLEPDSDMNMPVYETLVSPEVYQDVLANVEKAVDTGQSYIIEHPLNLKDGTYKDIRSTVHPVLDEETRVTKLFGVVQDVTDQKRAEKIERVLLNISNARHENDNLRALLQYIIQELGQLIEVKNCYIALYDERSRIYTFPYGTDQYDDDWTPQRLDRSLTDYVRRTGTPQLLLHDQNMHSMALDNDIKFIGTLPQVWLGVPLKLQQHIIGVIVLQDYDSPNTFQQSDLELLTYVGQNIANVIESKRAQEEHIELELQLQKNDFLQEFIGNMTHDIKTPLSVIKNSTYLLRNVKDPARRTEYIGRIDYQLERLDDMIEDILTISRLEHINESTQKQIQLNEMVTHITHQIMPKAQRKNIQLMLHLAADMPLIWANESDLTRAFLNLIENAIHYTQENGTVSVRTHQDYHHIFCEIHDTGIGIHPDNLPHIFDRFYRGENAQDVERGTGLGLAIVKRVIELHRGSIDVESELGHGTKMIITLKKGETQETTLSTE